MKHKKPWASFDIASVHTAAMGSCYTDPKLDRQLQPHFALNLANGTEMFDKYCTDIWTFKKKCL